MKIVLVCSFILAMLLAERAYWARRDQRTESTRVANLLVAQTPDLTASCYSTDDGWVVVMKNRYGYTTVATNNLIDKAFSENVDMQD